MFLYSFNLLLLVVFAIFYYRAAESEGNSGILWAGLSVAISAFIWLVLRWGLVFMLLGQIGLFFAITLIRTLRKS